MTELKNGPLLNAIEITQAKLLLRKATTDRDEVDELLSDLVQKSEVELQRQNEELAVAERLRQEQLERQEQEIAAAQRLHQETLKVQELKSAAEKLREEKLKHRVLYLCVGVALAVIGIAWFGLYRWKSDKRAQQLAYERDSMAARLSYDREKQALMAKALAFATENRRAEKIVQSAYNNFGLQNMTLQPDPEVGMLAAIDAVAVCRAAKIFVSPRYAFSVSFATALAKTEKRQVQDVDTKRLLMTLPAVISPDGKNMLTKTDNDVMLIRSDGTWQDLNAKGRVTAIGFDEKSARCGVELERGAVLIWSLHNLQDRLDASGPLSNALGIKEPDRLPEWFNMSPEGEAWEIGYDKVVNAELKASISGIMHRYPESERASIGVPSRVFTDDVNDAYKHVEAERLSEARTILATALAGIGVDSDDDTVNRTLAGNCFNRAISQPNSEIREKFFRIARAVAKDDKQLESQITAFEQKDEIKSLIEKANRYVEFGKELEARKALEEAVKMDPSLGTVEQQLQNTKQRLARDWMQRGNNFAEQDKSNEARMAFEEAIKMDPSLGTVEEQFQNTKLRLASGLMQQGNNFAREGKFEKAKEAYQKAISYDPSLRNRVDPETEWKKFAPTAVGAPPPESR